MANHLLSVGPFCEVEPSSFSRFVIPFGYDVEANGNGVSDDNTSAYAYHPINLGRTAGSNSSKWTRARWDYLTTETGQILFEQAKWFELRDAEGCGLDQHQRLSFEFKFRVDEQERTAKVESVMVILFDFPDLGKWRPSNKGPIDLLQTGFLIVDITFCNKLRLDELINFNERFRYYDEPFTGHFKDVITRKNRDSEKEKIYNLIESDALGTLRLSSVAAELNGDNFYSRWRALLTPIFRAKEGDFTLVTAFEVPEDKKKDLADLDQRNAHPDNRAFVWTCAILKEDDKQHNIAKYPSHYGHWVKLLNVDSVNGPVRATAFEQEWAKPRTYRRWEHCGTYYGFTSHSGAMLTSPPKRDLPTHFHWRYMYFDQMLFLLYLRVGLFRFSAKLNSISTEARRASDGERKWAKDFRGLRWDLALFTNLYQFPLLSNQQQAVEMYAIAREHMDVNVLFDEVQKEIHNSYEFLEQMEEVEQSKQARRLTLIATIVLPISLVIGLFGTDKEWWPAVASFPLPTGPGELSLKLLVFFALSFIYGLALIGVGLGLRLIWKLFIKSRPGKWFKTQRIGKWFGS